MELGTLIQLHNLQIISKEIKLNYEFLLPFVKAEGNLEFSFL
jgi:hypothetical protein